MLASSLRRFVPAAALLIAGAGMAGPAHAAETPSPDVQKRLDAVKAAYDKYQDPKVAVADGFAPDARCVTSPDGVMGYHYINSKLVEAGVDEMKPPVVIYQPDGKGGRKLVAVEYFKPDADQNLATSDDKPSVFDRQFDGPMEGHWEGMPKHYDMHVWLWQTNPKGVFVGFNPAGSCVEPATSTSSTSSTGGQVTAPSGGVQAGGGGTAGTENGWLFAVGAAATAAGAAVLTRGALAARRRG